MFLKTGRREVQTVDLGIDAIAQLDSIDTVTVGGGYSEYVFHKHKHLLPRNIRYPSQPR